MTNIMYLQNPYLFETPARIYDKGSDIKGIYLVFDRSPFYPQGGGQPADQGNITADDINYKVYDVRNLNGEIRHYIDTDNPDNICSEKEIMLSVDKSRRITNAKYHTAGHIIAAIAEKISPELTAIKGHQFPNEAYIELMGIVHDTDSFLKDLTNAVRNTINLDKAVKTEELSPDLAKIIAENLPYSLPENKSLRVCHIEGFSPVPCGGTHVNTLKDIGNITIQKCKSKKGKTKISYKVKT